MYQPTTWNSASEQQKCMGNNSNDIFTLAMTNKTWCWKRKEGKPAYMLWILTQLSIFQPNVEVTLLQIASCYLRIQFLCHTSSVAKPHVAILLLSLSPSSVETNPHDCNKYYDTLTMCSVIKYNVCP